MRLQSPQGVRGMAGDGNLGGAYQRSDADMDAVWSIAVAETRALIEGPWQ
jgi:creatinine amidohydrolase